MPALVLLWLLLLITARTVEEVRWVEALPALGAVATLALVAAYVLSRSRLPVVLLHAIGAPAIALIIIAAVATYRGLPEHLPLAFVLIAVTALWSYVAAWSVFRYRSMWFAVVASGAVVMAQLTWYPERAMPYFVAYVLVALTLASALARRAPSLAFAGAGSFMAVLALLVSFTAPLPGRTWQPAANLWPGLEQEVNRMLASAKTAGAVSVASASTSLAEAVTLGSSLHVQGKVDSSQDPVMTVTSDTRSYWRAGSYDQYTGLGWFRNMEHGPGQTYQARRTVAIEVELHQPSTFFVAAGLPLAPTGSTSLATGQTYKQLSWVSDASEAELRTAGTAYPAEVVNHYAWLPTNLPARVRDLANQWTLGLDNAYDKAVVLERRLRANFAYTLDVPTPPPGADAADHFLFDLQRGYCVHFATVLAVLLRAEGIPARIAVGYSSGEYDPASKTYLVRESHAHAWTEVYFPRYGWVEFDATPAYASLRSVLPNVTEDPVEAAPTIPDVDEEPVPAPTARVAPPTGVSPSPTLLLIALPTLLVIGVGVAWLSGLRGLSPAARSYEKVSRIASLRGAGPASAETPAEFAHRLGRLVPAAAHAISAIGSAYAQSRFSLRPAAGTDRQWRAIRRSLLRWAIASPMKGLTRRH